MARFLVDGSCALGARKDACVSSNAQAATVLAGALASAESRRLGFLSLSRWVVNGAMLAGSACLCRDARDLDAKLDA